MGNATSSPKETKFSHNHAEQSAWQHNGHVYGGAVYNFLRREDEITADSLKRLEALALDEKEAIKAREILQSLAYPDMDARREAIPDAVAGTFSWILQEVKDKPRETFHDPGPRNSPLREWLIGNDASKLFWLSGKAGSGKSTLMKFICDHHQTHSSLRSWAMSQNRRLFVAHHFFWYAGTQSQKSRQGLLQALLLQIGQADPLLLTVLCHERFSSVGQLHARRWTMIELWDCLRRLPQVPDAVFCFFVDGLDEFAPTDGHPQLARDVLEISALPNVKLCLSSRPWPAFKNHFVARSGCSIMKLEDLTGRDIREFATAQMKVAYTTCEAEFATEVDINHGFYSKKKYGNVVENLVQKANGVFLWARLVVASLCDRIMVGATEEELNLCLDDFPSELETYFRNMIYNRIGPTWKSGSETARCLQLAILLQDFRIKSSWAFREINCAIPNGTLLFHLATQKISWSWEAVVDYPHKSIAAPKSGQSLADWEVKIEACCQGLLNIQRRSGRDICCGKVEISHRTVFDFLASEEMRLLLKENVPAWFYDPELVYMLLCASCKITMTATEADWKLPHYHRKHTQPLLKFLSGKARHFVFERLERTAIDLDERNGLPLLLYFSPKSHEKWGTDTSFINFMTCFPRMGLFDYVQQIVAKQPQVAMVFDSKSVILEMYNALRLSTCLGSRISSWLDLVVHLIKNGADARCYWRVWQDMLEYVAKTDQTLGRQTIFEVWELSLLLINNGVLSLAPRNFLHGSNDPPLYIAGLQKCAAAEGLDNDSLEKLLMESSDPKKLEHIHCARLELRNRLWPDFRFDGRIVYRAWHYEGREVWIRHMLSTKKDRLHTVPSNAMCLGQDSLFPTYDFEIWWPIEDGTSPQSENMLTTWWKLRGEFARNTPLTMWEDGSPAAWGELDENGFSRYQAPQFVWKRQQQLYAWHKYQVP